ncbi:hypothetical protein [Brevundimonas sp.]|uniref:hypothetical protein n=1 Tax=Brevundimonas sp. TaxID=1871086 RepID=UPI0022BE379E|nr:hypothetical protein [Brevundimonas sp.]MCZ8195035.1 hypothetical protein [Brevundimonas sp.]
MHALPSRPLASRPWVEAGPLLAAAGLAVGPLPRINPLLRSMLMADFAAISSGGLPDFAFAPRLDAVTKPRVFPSLARLADHIERRRHGQPLELVDVEDIEIPGRAGLYRGVQVFTLLLDNGRDRCLGYAWLGGHGRERLEPALREARRGAARRSHADGRRAA